MAVRLSKQHAETLIKLILIEYLGIFHFLKSQRDGELVWPDHLTVIKNNLKLDNYVTLYDDEQKIRNSIFLFRFSKEERLKMEVENKTKSDEEKQTELDTFIGAFLKESAEHFQELHVIDESKIPELTDEEVKEQQTPENVERMQYLLLATLSLLHNVFSIMVYGVKLTRLVKDAINGDDKSFLKAIKIDHNLIHQHPYFKERIEQANKEQQRKFLNDVYQKQLSPSLNGRIQHGGLYTMFYFLDSLQLLDEYTATELNKLYTNCKITDLETPPYEPSSFFRHLQRFKSSR